MSDPSTTRHSDPLGSRPPTSHEQMTGCSWDASYTGGPAPWDIGHPQPAIARLASTEKFSGPVLDAGCGTGENTLLLASLGLPVLGVDVAGTAIAIARQKAAERGLHAEFAVADAFHLDRLNRIFSTVLDSGLFHTCSPEERPAYVASLASAATHAASLYILCFSDEGPEIGPHPVSEQDLRAAFHPSSGWTIAAFQPDRIHSRLHPDGASAWLVTLHRITPVPLR